MPQELRTLHSEFVAKIKAGEAKYRASGFYGKGFKFDGTDGTEDAAAAADIEYATHAASSSSSRSSRSREE